MRSKQPKARKARALKVGVRRSASSCHCPHPSDTSPVARILSNQLLESNQKLLRVLLGSYFLAPGFNTLLHRHLSSNCLNFQPVAATRKCVDAVLPLHHHAFDVESFEFLKQSFSIARNVIGKAYSTSVVLRKDFLQESFALNQKDKQLDRSHPGATSRRHKTQLSTCDPGGTAMHQIAVSHLHLGPQLRHRSKLPLL